MKEEEIKLLEQFLKILGFERKEDTSMRSIDGAKSIYTT